MEPGILAAIISFIFPGLGQAITHLTQESNGF